MTTDAINALMQESSGGTPWAKFPTLGSVVQGTIVDIKGPQQRKAFETNEPVTNKDGSPSMEIVVILQTDERDPAIEDDDGKRAVHAPIWYFDGCLRVAIMNAVVAAGQSAPAIGGTLVVQHHAMDGKAKCYQAKYEPPAPSAAADLMAPAAEAAPAVQSIF